MGASGRTPRPPTWQPVAPAQYARGRKVCGAVMAPAPSGRAQHARGSVGPGCGRRSGAAPLLGRGRCLAYRAWRRPALRGAPAPRLPRCAGGCGPSAARPPARLAPGVAAPLPVCARPCVGWAGLAWLRACGPRVASVRVAGSPRARFPPCASPRGARGGWARHGRALFGSAAALGPRGRGYPLRRGCVAPGSAV